MNQPFLRRPLASTAIYLILTLLIGVFVVLLPLNGAECSIVFNVQNLAEKTVATQAFQVLTYLGDFYLWVILATIYLLYTYFKSRKHFDSAIELATFLVITTALTYSLKAVFACPRPNCPGISTHEEDLLPSFSYPSGHISRATGAFKTLSRGSRTKEPLAVIAISIVSLSRIILGAHYPTDIAGGIFLSLAAQKLAHISIPFLKHKTKTSPT
jgi:undecaprenyl-diphosphatase